MPLHDGKIGTHKPDWLKIKLHNDPRYAQVSALVREHNLHTICASGRCPNISECWSRGTATFMIKGNICTRSCKFCATATGRPLPLDPHEPIKIARSVRIMRLRHCVITSVDRDDLPDGGCAHWAQTIRQIRELNPGTTIELLIPDFDARQELIRQVIEAGADIVGHNLETVRRLTPLVRSRAKYETSLEVLRMLADAGIPNLAKSGIMVGLGESEKEVLETMDDLAAAGVKRFTIGQYLQPTPAHYPVAEYVHPDTFAKYKEEAFARGILYTESGPLVRSSYMADRLAPGKQSATE